MEIQSDIFAPGRLFACSECGECKPLDGFYLQKKGRLRPFTKCKDCNKERNRAYQRKVRHEAPEMLKRWRESTGSEPVYAAIKKWRLRQKQQNTKWWQENVIRCRLRERMRVVLTGVGVVKAESSLQLLGCSIAEARTHLETLFQPGMSWENHGLKGWHIDHIRPCASFDLTDPEQQRQCFHYTNLQPLWWRENLSKGSRH